MIEIGSFDLTVAILIFALGCLVGWMLKRRSALKFPIAYFDTEFTKLGKNIQGFIDTLAAQAKFIEVLERQIQVLLHENKVLRLNRDGFAAKYEVLKEQNRCLQDSISALVKK